MGSPVPGAQVGWEVWPGRGERVEARPDVEGYPVSLAPIAVQHEQSLLLPRLAPGYCMHASGSNVAAKEETSHTMVT